MLAAVNVSPGWTVRPQLFSFVAFAALIVLLDRAFLRPARGPLWPIPLLFVAWVNLHAGFVAGLAVLVVYVAAQVVEDLLARDGRASADAARGIVLAVLCAGTVLCTPYGTAYVPWLLAAVTLHRPAISEWGAFASGDPRFVPFVALVALLAAAWLGSRRRRPLAHTAVLLVVAWQSCRHARHAPFLAVLAALWLPAHVQSLTARWTSPRTPSRPPAAVRAAAWAAAGILLLAVAARVRPPWVDAGIYPVDAFAYMRAHRLSGRLIAHFDWAQYAIYAFAPPTSLQFDGRFETAYPEEAADMHFDFLLGECPQRRLAGSPTRILEAGDPELVLVSRRYPEPAAIMHGRVDDWTLLYQDALAQLWGRRRKYDQPGSDFVVERAISDHTPAGRTPWPALP